ncbi:MAG TPA: sugar ABC transporter ATP-binding protein [Rectinemataceae bacterium]|nr:sugar ABC transporter ATP-binding protein [Rectinemataceae bacterium]
MEPNATLSLRNITKVYPGVVALDDVSIDFRQGEIHALLGENGAGKSTLVKVISGAIAPDSGTITVDGRQYRHMTPILSRQHGIEVMYQEFNLVEPLSVAENIFLGERTDRLYDRRGIERRAKELIERLNIPLDPHAIVERLSPGRKQLVEICKSVSHDVRILVLDEPTAPLSAAEVETLFSIISDLQKNGITIIYISHRMEELFRLADRVSVFRDGRFIATLETKKTDRQELVSLMVGRELTESYPCRLTPPGEVLLELVNLGGNGDRGISFSVRRGEIYGLAGLVGSGRTELMEVVFGVARRESGEVRVAGKPVDIRSPVDAIRAGLGLIPEDRKFLGCHQEHSILFNVSLAAIRSLSRLGMVDAAKERRLVDRFVSSLRIKSTSSSQQVRTLSGGNQQKVVLAKALAAEPDILVFDEPTRGIDVGAKQEVYQLMNQLAAQGKAVVMISSDQEELLGMSDKIGVLYEGRFAGELERREFDPELIVGLASGMRKEDFLCRT